MSVVPFLSLSGAPGVTTLACLVASTWAGQGPVAVVECDPSGGDLAARFGLTPAVGWSSLSAATRRTGPSTPLAAHLQPLPGGLPVLVGTHEGAPVPAHAPAAGVVRAGFSHDAPPGVAIVDLGRALPGPVDPDGWLGAADYAVLVVGDDPSAALRVRGRASELLERTGGRLGLVVVGGTTYRCQELAEFTGIAALCDIPFDPQGAAVASGASSAGRRLERSRLLASARRLGDGIAARTGAPGAQPDPTDGTAEPLTEPLTETRLEPAPVSGGARSPMASLLSSMRPTGRRSRALVDGAI